MIELGSADGSRGYTVPHWQSAHPINVVWIETSVGSDEYEPWYAIDAPGSTLLSFADFADSKKTGRVFSWNAGNIEFSPNVDEGSVPDNGCKIKAPNIIFSTVDPFGSTITAKIQYDEGGHVSIKDAAFSDFNATLKGIGQLDLERVAFYGSAYIQYCNDFNLNDVHAGIKDNYSTGLSFSYSSNGVMNNISGASTKTKGVTFNYLKDVKASNVSGLVAKRDSSTDYPVYLATVQGSEISDVKCRGGALKLYNVSACRLSTIETIDSVLLEENSSSATTNIDVENSSATMIRGWTVPINGGAKIAYLKIKNSPKIDVVKAEINSSFATNVISGDVSFGTRISELHYEGFTGADAFYMPAKNNGVLMQHITSPARGELSIEAPNAIIKGIDASSIKTDNPGTTGSNFAQLYTTDTDGKIVFIMAKDSVETNFFSGLLGGLKFSNNGRAYFTAAGDAIEMTTPYRVKGVTFQNIEPVLGGHNLGALAFDYAINLGDGYINYKALNAENLSSEAINPEDGFLMKIRAVSGTISGITYISSIELITVDDRYIYPLDFEVGRIAFADNAVIDEDAMFFAYYTDGYGTVDAVMIRDADGQPVTGLVGGRDYVDFSYDFVGDDSNGRTADEPFGITVVLAGTDMAQNIVINQVFDEGQLNVFSLRPDKEYAYLGV